MTSTEIYQEIIQEICKNQSYKGTQTHATNAYMIYNQNKHVSLFFTETQIKMWSMETRAGNGDSFNLSDPNCISQMQEYLNNTFKGK